MPKLTIAASGRATIDRATLNPVPASRRGLILYLVSGDAWMGWNADVDQAGATTAGIPLPTAQPVAFGSDMLNLDAPVHLYSTAGAVVHYQELLKP